MTELKLHNSLTGKKENFEPIDPEHIRMYVCGPTVYDRPHIGNARAVVVYDMLYRLLCNLYGVRGMGYGICENEDSMSESALSSPHRVGKKAEAGGNTGAEGGGCKVTYVRNITDVDDKIIKAAEERNVSVDVVTKEVTDIFHKDMAALGNVPPSIEPKATEHIPQMIETIEKLIKNGNAYEAQGHVLFAVESAENYGKLSGKKLEDLIAGARVEVESYKKNAGDFVLWKPSADDEPGWESPWGRGRPGWHIECTAMSHTHLGADFDIHGGGADLKFPHHENEIAQGCCAVPGSHYAHTWVHNGFVTVGGEKMSKSLGNFTTVQELLEQGISGDAIRLGLLSAHYRKPLDIRDGIWDDMQKMLNKWASKAADAEAGELPKAFTEALCDDMNVPLAFSAMHEAEAGELKAMAEFLGLSLQAKVAEAIPQHLIDLKNQRDEAKANKDWAEADRLRDDIQEAGYQIQDGKDGSKLVKE